MTLGDLGSAGFGALCRRMLLASYHCDQVVVPLLARSQLGMTTMLRVVGSIAAAAFAMRTSGARAGKGSTQPTGADDGLRGRCWSQA